MYVVDPTLAVSGTSSPSLFHEHHHPLFCHMMVQSSVMVLDEPGAVFVDVYRIVLGPSTNVMPVEGRLQSSGGVEG